jgi:hypothetical protein
MPKKSKEANKGNEVTPSFSPLPSVQPQLEKLAALIAAELLADGEYLHIITTKKGLIPNKHLATWHKSNLTDAISKLLHQHIELMDAKTFADATERQIACGPLDQLPSALKHCWDVDRLRHVKEQIESDTQRRVGLILSRMDFIRAH